MAKSYTKNDTAATLLLTVITASRRIFISSLSSRHSRQYLLFNSLPPFPFCCQYDTTISVSSLFAAFFALCYGVQLLLPSVDDCKQWSSRKFFGTAKAGSLHWSPGAKRRWRIWAEATKNPRPTFCKMTVEIFA